MDKARKDYCLQLGIAWISSENVFRMWAGYAGPSPGVGTNCKVRESKTRDPWTPLEAWECVEREIARSVAEDGRKATRQLLRRAVAAGVPETISAEPTTCRDAVIFGVASYV